MVRFTTRFAVVNGNKNEVVAKLITAVTEILKDECIECIVYGDVEEENPSFMDKFNSAADDIGSKLKKAFKKD